MLVIVKLSESKLQVPIDSSLELARVEDFSSNSYDRHILMTSLVITLHFTMSRSWSR